MDDKSEQRRRSALGTDLFNSALSNPVLSKEEKKRLKKQKKEQEKLAKEQKKLEKQEEKERKKYEKKVAELEKKDQRIEKKKEKSLKKEARRSQDSCVSFSPDYADSPHPSSSSSNNNNNDNNNDNEEKKKKKKSKKKQQQSPAGGKALFKQAITAGETPDEKAKLDKEARRKLRRKKKAFDSGGERVHISKWAMEDLIKKLEKDPNKKSLLSSKKQKSFDEQKVIKLMKEQDVRPVDRPFYQERIKGSMMTLNIDKKCHGATNFSFGGSLCESVFEYAERLQLPTLSLLDQWEY